MAGRQSKKQGDSTGASIKLENLHMPRFTGQQMNAALTEHLPALKAEREKRETRGRKTTYTRERFLRVLEHMGAGKTLRASLELEKIAPSVFLRWTEQADGTEEEASFCRASLARAKHMLADHTWSEALDVPRQLYAMAMEGNAKGKPVVDSAMVAAAKLLTDSLWRYAERLRPGEYADKQKEIPVVNVTNNSLTISGRDLDADQRQQLRALLASASTSQGPVIDAE